MLIGVLKNILAKSKTVKEFLQEFDFDKLEVYKFKGNKDKISNNEYVIFRRNGKDKTDNKTFIERINEILIKNPSLVRKNTIIKHENNSYYIAVNLEKLKLKIDDSLSKKLDEYLSN